MLDPTKNVARIPKKNVLVGPSVSKRLIFSFEVCSSIEVMLVDSFHKRCLELNCIEVNSVRWLLLFLLLNRRAILRFDDLSQGRNMFLANFFGNRLSEEFGKIWIAVPFEDFTDTFTARMYTSNDIFQAGTGSAFAMLRCFFDTVGAWFFKAAGLEDHQTS